MDFPARLKKLREEKGLNQYQLADKLFVSRSAVAKWEQGKGMPNPAAVEGLCQLFALSSEELFASDQPESDYVSWWKKRRKKKRILLISCSLLAAGVLSIGVWGIVKACTPKPTYVLTPNAFFFVLATFGIFSHGTRKAGKHRQKSVYV